MSTRYNATEDFSENDKNYGRNITSDEK